MSFLDNGLIRVGVDLDVGGSITYLGRSSARGENVINSHDMGRQIQQSYYSGPAPFGRPHRGWPGWGWNPIGSGDVYGNRSQVIEHTNDGQRLYLKAIPLQWALENKPGECTFETWLRVKGSVVEARYRLVNHRPDKTFYAARDQELPAVYTIGRLHRLVTYRGNKPFEDGQEPSWIENAGPPWTSWTASECWAALLDDQGWGLGVVHPGVYRFLGGFHGPPNQGGPKDNSTGYIAPVRREVLDHDIVYEYNCAFVLGTLQEIRREAARRRIDTRPDHDFSADRERWTYHEAQDEGFPPEGTLRVRPTGGGAQLVGPDQWWSAQEVPRLYLRASYRGVDQHQARLFWKTPEGDEFSPERSVEFAIKGDGQMRTYEIPLEESAAYRGTIAGLRLAPFASGGLDQELVLDRLSWRRDSDPEPKEREAGR